MKRLTLLLLIIFSVNCFGHPMPNSVVLFDVKSNKIVCELQLPLKELQPAVPFDVTTNLDSLLKNHEAELRSYILSHFHIKGESQNNWLLMITNLRLAKAEQTATGVYQELIAEIVIAPVSDENIRNFTIYYDIIMHQVVNHRAILTVRQDWDNGQVGDQHSEIGTIAMDTRLLKVFPVKINLSEGNNWKGFKSMVTLGMQHISEGTDHLLFLLVLLLSAPLLSDGKKWIGSGTTHYTVIRILKITFAFTLGHSITLILGTIGLLQVNPKPIEILIAVSILITAIHVIKPLFPSREVFIASGFGLLHGLAFATTLVNLNLETGKLALSLLGFNIGIEVMQIIVIVLVMPWFIILSKYGIYKPIRLMGATLAVIASIAWLCERYYDTSNFISDAILTGSKYSLWVIFVLAVFTMLYTLDIKFKRSSNIDSDD